MKRLTAILVAGIFLLAPLSVSAMEMMDDSSMKDVTGQAGVSIAVDDVVLYQESIADTTYWDTDGADNFLLEATDPGPDAVDSGEYGVKIDYVNDMQKLITIDAIVSDEQGPYSHGELADLFEADQDAFDVPDFAGVDNTGVSPLTIDVGVAGVLTTGFRYNVGANPEKTLPDGTTVTPYANFDATDQIAGVVIGLPTVEITQFHTTDERAISLTKRNADGDTVVNDGNEFISIEQSGTSKMAILGGRVEIAPH